MQMLLLVARLEQGVPVAIMPSTNKATEFIRCKLLVGHQGHLSSATVFQASRIQALYASQARKWRTIL